MRQSDPRVTRPAAKWRRLGWASFALSAAITAVSVALEWHARTRFDWPGSGNTASTVVSGLLYAGAGAIIIDRLGSHRVGWLFCTAGIGWALPAAAGTAAEYARLAPGHFWGEGVVIWSSAWSPYVAFGSVPVLMLFVFPSGATPARKWWPFMGMGVFGLIAGIVGAALAPGPYIDHPEFTNIYGIDGAVGKVMRFFEVAAWPIFLVAMAGGVSLLVSRMRRGTESERQQIKWILFAGAAVAVFVLFWGLMAALGNEALAQRWRGWALGVIPVAVGIAVLRHRLYDIDVIINRALVYTTLSGVLAVVYFGSVVLLQQMTSSVIAESQIVVAGVTLAVAALFRPLRQLIQGFIDRRFYRRRYDAAEKLGAFTVRLRDQVDLDSLSSEVLAVVGTTVEPAHASLWFRPPPERRAEAAP